MTAPTDNGLVPAEIFLGVVGLGLMGSSIVAALLIAGHPVVGIAPLNEELEKASSQINEHLEQCKHAGLLDKPVNYYLNKVTISGDYGELKSCRVVLECVTERIDIKKQVYNRISNVVPVETIISSNTSAIPISILQSYVPNPGRFLGIHWAEPAYMTRFLEVTCGKQTTIENANWIYQLAHHWGKEPTLLKKDIRGFVTNRLMYAVYREALTMEENGDATIEDLDKAIRYDAGSWITLMGIFRRMDYMGLENLESMLKNTFPLLSNREDVPVAMQKMVTDELKGTRTSKGFYTYTENEGSEWEEAFARFNKDIARLAARYPSKDRMMKDASK